MKLKDKVAIVVGGASGVGKATSRLLAQEGARVVIADLDIETANKVADGIREGGGEVSTVKVDMTKEGDANEMARITLDKYGQIDILANVAGGSMGRFIRDKIGPFVDSTKEEWDRIIDINLNGARNCTRAVINHMIERGSGKIVSFSSIAAIQGMRGGVDYAAAKAGIIGFTKALALEMAPYGIHVNCITPGGVATERIRAFFKARKERDPEAPEIDMSKFAMPEEFASVVLFLVSDEVSHITGENIIVAGARG
jgi:3-oxoacyl-[acyl-carrier protein] reductase